MEYPLFIITKAALFTHILKMHTSGHLSITEKLYRTLMPHIIYETIANTTTLSSLSARLVHRKIYEGLCVCKGMLKFPVKYKKDVLRILRGSLIERTLIRELFEDRSTKYLKYVMIPAFNLALIFRRH